VSQCLLEAGPGLLWDTPAAWAPRALEQPLALLDDHAHCELGAAAAAQALIARNPHYPQLADRLAALAQEELAHFRRVHDLLVQRGGSLGPARRNPYVEGLDPGGRRSREEALLDRLLIAALIERRSLERFEALAVTARGGDADLARLFADLGPSERGHGLLFVNLAQDLFPGADVGQRYAVLAQREADHIRGLAFAPRVHSGPPPP